MASANANRYFSKFSPEKQEEIRASWGGQDLMDQWYQNAVQAGATQDPGRELGTQGGQRATKDLTAADIQSQVDTTIPVEQFQAYINEGHLDPSCPPDRPFRQDQAHMKKWFGGQGYDANACVEKPTDQVGASGGNNQGQSGQGGGQQSGPPPPPTTFGQNLTLTGDPMTDMLLQQFNTKHDFMGMNKNIFGLGEDRAVGGEGANADMQNVKGQLLEGGGLWWGGEGFNQGYRADQAQKPGKPGRKRRGAGRAASPPPSPADIAAPPPPATTIGAGTPGPGANLPTYKNDLLGGGQTQMQQMLKNRGYASTFDL